MEQNVAVIKYIVMNTPANSPLKGVNLGGWLVLERWMTPSLFAGTKAANEYELAQIPGKTRAIQRHHETFITEEDIAWLQKAGVQALRVPVGFWVLHGHHPYQSARARLDWLFVVAKKYQLKVLLCLHAAPGAQNNNDHSGSGTAGGFPGWYRAHNRRMTQTILLEFAERYGADLWGIELLNEPHVPTPYHYALLRRWTNQTIKQLRAMLPGRVHIIASDAYMPALWSGFIRGETLDVHHYQCFSKASRRLQSLDEHLALLESAQKRYRSYARQQPLIIGEWSATLPHQLASTQANRAFCQAQLQAWQPHKAWFFWSYKTENNDSWNFRHLYEAGYFADFL